MRFKNHTERAYAILRHIAHENGVINWEDGRGMAQSYYIRQYYMRG